MKKYFSKGLTITIILASIFVGTSFLSTKSAEAQFACTPILTRNLTIGSTGADVTALQNFLNIVPATGYFGYTTRAAVMAYQTANGLYPATGFVGPLTINSINIASCDTPPVTPIINPLEITLLDKSIVIQSALGNDDTQAVGTFKFKATAIDRDVWISGDLISAINVIKSDQVVGKASPATLTSISGALSTSTAFLVQEGNTETFVITYIINPNQGSGAYKAKAIKIPLLDGLDGNIDGPNNQFVSNTVYLQSSTVVTPTLPSITPSEVTIDSGASVKFDLTYPQNTTNASLKFTCPSGVTSGTIPDVCNGNYINVTSNTDWTIHLVNSTSKVQYVNVAYSVNYPDPMSSKDQNTTVLAKITINPKVSTPSITVLSPNGGEILAEGQNYTIRWSNKNIPSTSKIIVDAFQYSGEDDVFGSPNTQIAVLPSTATSYSWKVSGNNGNWGIGLNGFGKKLANLFGIRVVNAEADQYKISVRAYDQSYPGLHSAGDVSDSYFKIVAPTPAVPNVYEEVKCVFNKSTQPQYCSTTNKDGKTYSFASIGSASGKISGYLGEKLIWKSSCGDKMTTTMDGNNEVIYFNCAPVTSTPTVPTAPTTPTTPVVTFPSTTGMKSVAGDYNGDGKFDVAYWNPTDGKWYIKDNNGNVITNGKQYGGSTMTPVSGDYDGDGVYDLALWNKSDGMWYIYSLAKNNNLAWAKQYGGSTMTPQSTDYDKDGAHDLAVKNTDGKWYIFSLKKNTNLVWGETNISVTSMNPEDNSNYATVSLSWDLFLKLLQALR